MDDVRGCFLGLSHKRTQAVVTTNKNIKMGSFKSNVNNQKKGVVPDCTVSNNKLSIVTLNELANTVIYSSFNKA